MQQAGAAETVSAASGATEAAAQTATQVVASTIYMVNNQQMVIENARLVGSGARKTTKTRCA